MCSASTPHQPTGMYRKKPWDVEYNFHKHAYSGRALTWPFSSVANSVLTFFCCSVFCFQVVDAVRNGMTTAASIAEDSRGRALFVECCRRSNVEIFIWTPVFNSIAICPLYIDWCCVLCKKCKTLVSRDNKNGAHQIGTALCCCVFVDMPGVFQKNYFLECQNNSHILIVRVTSYTKPPLYMFMKSIINFQLSSVMVKTYICFPLVANLFVRYAFSGFLDL